MSIKQQIIKKDEKILVVARNDLFGHSNPQGIVVADEKQIHNKIKKHQKFKWRSLVEQDPTLKQIVPYLIFRHKDQLFLMQRKAKATEQRLKNKYTLGIGGHIREDDLAQDSILDWSRREFAEEINFCGSFTPTFIGLLNDEIDDVGKVHTGIVYMLEGDSDAISVKSELESGMLTTIEECSKIYNNMERWSQITLDHIKSLGSKIWT